MIRFFPQHRLTREELSLIPEALFCLISARFSVSFLPSRYWLPHAADGAGHRAQSEGRRAKGEGQASEGATERLRDSETKGLDEDGKQAQSTGQMAQGAEHRAQGGGDEGVTKGLRDEETKRLRDEETKRLRDEDGEQAQGAEHRAQGEEKTKDINEKIKDKRQKIKVEDRPLDQSQITNHKSQITNSDSLLTADNTKIKNLAGVINGLATRTPWKSTCLVKALAAHKMFRRRDIPHSVHFGMKKNDSGKFEAHAWVSVGSRVVIGGENSGEYREVGRFEG